eukprot:m.14759 g.14759  ORF g.14759 m.14759 type:complete len:553 (+) comp5197_c0_seq1:187-1845(+)
MPRRSATTQVDQGMPNYPRRRSSDPGIMEDKEVDPLNNDMKNNTYHIRNRNDEASLNCFAQNMSKAETEEAVRNGENGDFLLWKKNNSQYFLIINDEGEPTIIRIKYTANKFTFAKAKCLDIPSLLREIRCSFLTSRSGGRLKLGKPCAVGVNFPGSKSGKTAAKEWEAKKRRQQSFVAQRTPDGYEFVEGEEIINEEDEESFSTRETEVFGRSSSQTSNYFDPIEEHVYEETSPFQKFGRSYSTTSQAYVYGSNNLEDQLQQLDLEKVTDLEAEIDAKIREKEAQLMALKKRRDKRPQRQTSEPIHTDLKTLKDQIKTSPAPPPRSVQDGKLDESEDDNSPYMEPGQVFEIMEEYKSESHYDTAKPGPAILKKAHTEQGRDSLGAAPVTYASPNKRRSDYPEAHSDAPVRSSSEIPFPDLRFEMTDYNPGQEAMYDFATQDMSRSSSLASRLGSDQIDVNTLKLLQTATKKPKKKKPPPSATISEGDELGQQSSTDTDIWQYAKTDTGRIYYINMRTSETSWCVHNTKGYVFDLVVQGIATRIQIRNFCFR